MKKLTPSNKKGATEAISKILKKPLSDYSKGEILVKAEQAIINAENIIMETRINALETAIEELKHLKGTRQILDSMSQS